MQISVALHCILEKATCDPVGGGREARRRGKETLSCLKTWQLYLRAVAFNLNPHFFFYFQILPGILGMLRRAAYKALSTRWSRTAGRRHVLMETNHLSASSLQTLNKSSKGSGKETCWLASKARVHVHSPASPKALRLFNARLIYVHNLEEVLRRQHSLLKGNPWDFHPSKLNLTLQNKIVAQLESVLSRESLRNTFETSPKRVPSSCFKHASCFPLQNLSFSCRVLFSIYRNSLW